MKSAVTFVLSLLLCLPARAAQPTDPAPAAPSPVEIDAAIKKGVEWLYAQQSDDGHWEEGPQPVATTANHDSIDGGQWGGQSALAVYALIMAGEKPTEPKLAKSIAWLRKQNLVGVYALAIRCQVWLYLPDNAENKQAMRKDALALMAAGQDMAKKKGSHQIATWDYLLKGTGYSLSRTQYALLALWAASQTGVEIPAAFWKKAEQTWIDAQTPDGGWTYKHPDDTEYAPTVGMTAAGLATLYIAEDFTVAPKFVNAAGNPPANPAIAKALAWIIKHWDTEVATDTGDLKRIYPFSALYAVERVGLASGLRRFGEIDWYGRGSTWLLTKQRRDGAFSQSTARGGKKGLQDTCFAILFLARGRVPVAFNKLDYTSAVADAKSAVWNQRPRDIANLTRVTTRELERELRWQTVTLADTDEALAESPILYLSGSKELKFNADIKAKLKTFVDHGGLLFVVADGTAGKPFTASVQKLLSEIYPAYDFRELPATHPLYTNQIYQREKWKTKPQIVGMSNGVRELALIVPAADWGRSWQTGRVDGKEDAWQFGQNLVLYMNDKTHFRPRGGGVRVVAKEPAKSAKTVKIARIEHKSGWDPEPAAWTQMAAVLANESGITATVETVKLGNPLDGYDVAHLTGTGAVTLDAAAAASLKKFVAAGGTVLIDAAGGSTEFGSSLEAQLPTIFGGQLAALPAASPLNDIVKSAGYRAFTQRDAAKADTRLRCIEVANRPAVIFSKLDLTAGLVGYEIDGITGYDPATARALVTAVVKTAAK